MQSALIVAVPEAEDVVAAWRAQHDPAAAMGVPAHITVLYPFLEAAVVDEHTEEIERVAGGVEPFRFTLRRIERFPDVLYLAPDPDAPFRRLTESIWQTWPDFPPYGGAYDDVVPHLTLAQTGDHDVFPTIAAAVASQLPVVAVASQLTLIVEDESGRWRTRRSFPLG